MKASNLLRTTGSSSSRSARLLDLRLDAAHEDRAGSRRSGTASGCACPMKIGDTIQKIAIARFARTLSTLVSSGVDIIKALEITGQASGNVVIEDALVDVRNSVREGASIAEPLIDDPVFPPMVSQMVRIGEETGELDEDAGEDRRLLRGRGRGRHRRVSASMIEPLMMIARRCDGRHHPDRHVPADVQDAQARQQQSG